ncbi:hypothetical protein PPSIR1_16780 [Plesiocystis pacifica SIR-1]|uniref:Lipoprotein n=1 Tax=Plesiocystis pacifica SIR-1 TaxID=391625 RepID=A6G3B1_9BACT|nr:hypothetical protein PPSIR1_16780 [Plesiocystis pacifica SIR-1]
MVLPPRALGQTQNFVLAPIVLACLSSGCGDDAVLAPAPADAGPAADGWTFIVLRQLDPEDESTTNPRLVALRVDEGEAEPIELRELIELGGSRSTIETWDHPGHGVIVQNTHGPWPAWLTRVESGEPVVSPVRMGYPRKLTGVQFTPSGGGALIRSTANLPDDPLSIPPEPDCSLEWIRYDSAREPVERVELEPVGYPDCSQQLPAFALSPAADLALWLVRPDWQPYVLRAATIVDGLPGPVQTLASFEDEDHAWSSQLYVDAARIGYLVRSGSGFELAVHDRLHLDEPAERYPMTTDGYPRTLQTEGWMVWSDEAGDSWRRLFDGPLAGEPERLDSPPGYRHWLHGEDELRFLFPGAGIAHASALSAPGPVPLTTLTEPLLGTGSIAQVVENLAGWTVFERLTEDPDETSAVELVSPGPDAAIATAVELGPDVQVDFQTYAARPERVLIAQTEPLERVSLVDVGGDTPTVHTLIERQPRGSETAKLVRWSGEARHVLLNSGATIERVFIGGGEPEPLLDLGDERIATWWSLSEPG